MGGHASTFICGRANFAVRPDVLWKTNIDLDSFPDPSKSKGWRRRTVDHVLDPEKTIEENLVEAIKVINRKRKFKMFLSGWCSIKKKFLTLNKINAVCIVRHPLHAYISFFKNQHPNHSRPYGGFNTAGAVDYWFSMWEPIIEDIMSSGNPIVRYEYFLEDFPECKFKDKLKKFDSSKRNYGHLSKGLEDRLHKYVENWYFQLYDKWNI